ncbi:MAG: methylmalonyl Co-A mutase-associated GTPase MeaB [Myxococcota bacterium]
MGATSPQELVQRVLEGNRRAIARAMRIVDERDAGYLDLLRALHPHTGRAYLVGVTGTPGAGKSTLVDRLVRAHRDVGRSVGVVAVDPTSPFSGGAILGDRIRMQQHFTDRDVFIRSLATRGHLGGLSRSAGDVMRVLDAGGFDVVLVETVGVGQDELEVARLAHTTVVVMAPGLGDDIQAIKAGILEVADVFAVNKADREGADNAVRDIEQMIALGEDLVRAAAGARGHSAAVARRPRKAPDEGGGWVPPVVKTVAVRGEGVADLIDACDRHRAFLFETEEGRRVRSARARQEFRSVFREAMVLEAERRIERELAAGAERVAAGEADPYSETARLVERTLGPHGDDPAS